jgi:DNA invertase Pin-like site-specific DNA recombinase
VGRNDGGDRGGQPGDQLPGLEALLSHLAAHPNRRVIVHRLDRLPDNYDGSDPRLLVTGLGSAIEPCSE